MFTVPIQVFARNIIPFVDVGPRIIQKNMLSEGKPYNLGFLRVGATALRDIISTHRRKLMTYAMLGLAS